ncbi:MAG: hypothetical protein KIT00_11710 [Rhodospirillales bacterium]|nr:hypothetical protein [Rhodospirillales bacterium]
MSAVVKYLFDRRFESPVDFTPKMAGVDSVSASKSAAGDEPEVVVVHDEPVPLVFTEEDLKRAHQEGFAEGRRDAETLAANTTEERTAQALALIAKRFAEILETGRVTDAAIAKQATQLALAVTDKVFPDFSRRGALGEIERTAEAVMTLVLDQPRLAVVVNAELHESIAERIRALADREGFAGHLDVTADMTMAWSDCRITWRGGGANREVAALRRDIEERIEQAVAPGIAGATNTDVTVDGPPTDDISSPRGMNTLSRPIPA